ncbi:hypothetical protein [uncultured Roseovarius sp.]|uniref:hypothetical protein n=1 Tax=uncultured Roseovarius sp. TaxID=293344 RepID=UPI00260B87B9|nr:hypothetical protein [uncultured Roseovarius sp.]
MTKSISFPFVRRFDFPKAVHPRGSAAWLNLGQNTITETAKENKRDQDIRQFHTPE